ncbi:class I SAM-dependent methyltransferase [Streptomyces sp. NPDC050287]|uniref:class I SAM-dependent methyltransferase n=1 Tax=Streptomyces sp. NPDC050287 TaxID=3365608 RepID=UPI0037B83655
METSVYDLCAPSLERLLVHVLDAWPEHRTYLRERFDSETRQERRFSEIIADKILRITAENTERYARNYRWTCDRMKEEEFYFGVTGHYRHDSFEKVLETVYSDAAFMEAYTDGLLLSQLLWANHARSLEFYEREVLARISSGASVLEVGPGHGLLLAMAAKRTGETVVGWDVSDGSITATDRALRMLGIERFSLHRQDLLAPFQPAAFDLVVASELLEHLDRPEEALLRLLDATRAGGLLYVNVPVNSPAPDHITLWRTPEEALAFIEGSGAEIVRHLVSPMTGSTEQQARAQQLTLSCAVLCRRPV